MASQSPSLEQIPPPPRKLQRRKVRSSLGCLVMAIIPFILIGIALVITIPVRLYVQYFGNPVRVVVEGKTVSGSTRTNTTNGKTISIDTRFNYQVQFHYVLRDQLISDSQQVTESEFQPIRPNQIIIGHVVNFGGYPICLTNAGNLANANWRRGGVAAVFCAFPSLFLMLLLQPRARQRHLLREGVVTTGTVTNRDKAKGRATAWIVFYSFETADKHHLVASQKANWKQYDKARTGDAVTVFYDPANPQRSMAYEFGDFEIVNS